MDRQQHGLAYTLNSGWRHRDLILQLIKREVIERYRGSVFGLVWSFMHPMFMLAVYLFVFGVVLKLRWGLEGETNVQFAVVLFAGLIVHALYAECLVRAPQLILANKHLVTKLVFPLEILSIVSVGTAVFHMIVGLFILILINGIVHGQVHSTIVFVPVVIFPLFIIGLGTSWFLASLGVFLRDIAHIVGILATVLLFMSPIFYPISAVPETLIPFMYMNPLTVIVEELRSVVIFGKAPNWENLMIYLGVALILLGLGNYWFARTRRAFADVV